MTLSDTSYNKTQELFHNYKKINIRNKSRPIFDKLWMIFLTSQKIIYPVKKQRKFKPQMNEKHFQLDKKLFQAAWKIDFLNYLKTTWKGPMYISTFDLTITFQNTKDYKNCLRIWIFTWKFKTRVSQNLA